MIVLSLALFAGFHFGEAQTSGTNVQGTITSDTTWTQANGPYNLTGNTLINNGVTLAIKAGTTINLNNYEIEVNGTLQAIGNSTNLISFNNGQVTFTQYSANWTVSTGTGCIIKNANVTSEILLGYSTYLSNNILNGPIITDGGQSIIANNTITGGIGVSGYETVSNNTILNQGISIVPSNVTISDNTISDTPIAIDVFTLGDNPYYSYNYPLIEGNLIVSNTYGLRVRCEQDSEPMSPLILNNTIADNTVGIYLANFLGNPDPVILNNNICDNYNYSVQTDLSNNITATHNWWGTTDTRTINQTIYDYYDDSNLGNVSYIPFLTAPNAEAPPIPLGFIVNASAYTVDQGQTAVLSLDSLSGGTGPYSYKWFEMAPNGTYAAVGTNSPNFNFTTFDSGPLLPPTTATGIWSFTLQVTDSTGAAANSTASITVNSALIPSSITASLFTLDQGEISVLNALNYSETGTSPYAFQWFAKPPGGSYGAVGLNQPSFTFITLSNTTAGSWSFILQLTDGTGAVTNSTATLISVNVPAATPTPIPTAPPTQRPTTSPTNSPTPPPTATPTASFSTSSPSPAHKVPEFPSVNIALIALMAASTAVLFCIRKSKESL